jgi:CO/xanthine dehydrogenase FAD-binding subunit/aerobic-type carbon monoxide dehydrogenase small subunit (CoxS/CutS family)
MITQEFEFRSPDKLDEVLTLLAEGGDEIKLLSGGMSLMPMMALGLVRPRIVLSLNRIEGRGYVKEDRDALRIGAGTRHYEILRDPLIARHCGLLSEAAAFIGDTQVRNRGTVGGSLAHADPAADYGPVLVVAEARVIVRSKRGEREIAASKFFTNLMETALTPDEVITEVIVPKLGAARSAYTRLHRVEGNFAIVNAAAILSDRAVQVALGGVGAIPLALDVSAELARGVSADALKAVGQRVRAACIDAPEDLNATADYRSQMAAVYAERALTIAAGRVPSQQTPEAGRKPAPSGSTPRKTAPGTIGGTLRTAVAVSVNGQPRRVEADNRMILADLLREVIGLTGTHIGCGTGSCGACTVMLDGRTVKSCSVLAADVDGCTVETIESLASDIHHLHPLQESFVRNHGQQCGYCTPGMVMSALQLLRDNPNPDDAAIRHGISGNLCRCTGYQFIVNAISDAARALRASKPQPPA